MSNLTTPVPAGL